MKKIFFVGAVHRTLIEQASLSKWLFAGLLALVFPAESMAAIISLSPNSAYTQPFDSLANSGTANSWLNDSTISGWNAGFETGTLSTYRGESGAGTTGALYSYGVAGVNAVTDRALGSVSSGTPDTIFFGAAFSVNALTTSFVIQYHGEEWHRGENANTLTFAYFIGDPTSIQSTEVGWTTVSALNFTGPQSGTVAALDGNAVANSATVSATISGLNLASGNHFWIRWSDPNDAGSDAGLAIDDFSITAVPEASTWYAGVGLSLAMLGTFVRKIRK